jgi:prephenate dehydratase
MNAVESGAAKPGPVTASAKTRLAYQGEPGANSHIACLEVYPDCEPVALATFEEAFAAVAAREVAYAMIPVENSVAGRVADIHHLMPDSNLYIVGEHFLRVRHQLLAVPGAQLDTIRTVASHVHALGQCRKTLAALGLKTVIAADTAGAAAELARSGDKTRAAIATSLAADIYGLEALKSDIEDEEHNTTRFLILSADPQEVPVDGGPVITTFLFRVRNVPAALYKALGGFATNGVNMTKLESYQLGGRFFATQFYADIEGHPSQRLVRLALEELEFFTSYLRVLGVYRGSPMRAEFTRRAGSDD